jgi:hypothetical protein
MKKTNRPRKLTLQQDTVKTLQIADMAQVVGGSAQPTTTVLPTGRC